MRKTTLYVSRSSKTQQSVNSAPCEKCMRYIRRFNIKILIFSMDEEMHMYNARDYLNKVGISYSKLSKKGFEIPVISINIKYKHSFIHGEKFVLISQFKLENKIRLICKTAFLKSNGDIGAEARIELVVVRKLNDSIKLVREIPVHIKNILLMLEEGPKA